ASLLFHSPPPPEIYTLSLHDALPIFPRPLDYLVVLDVLLFLYLTGMTILRGKRRTTTAIVLYLGLFLMALLYLPGMIATDHQTRSEEHTSELQSRENLVCRLLLEKKK